MKIIRDGKEYELTRPELHKAYEEYQHLLDVDFVRDTIQEISEDRGVTVSEKFLKPYINVEDCATNSRAMANIDPAYNFEGMVESDVKDAIVEYIEDEEWGDESITE